jgi:hypothetical protein
MKKYTNRVDELKKSQDEMTMEEFLKDDRGCWIEGEAADGRQIWSCPEKFGIGITGYKILDEQGRLKVKFNEVDDFNITHDISSLDGGPNKARAYKTGGDKLLNLKGFAKQVKDVEISFADNLTSLEGLPKTIEGNLSISFCKNLTSLKGIPEYIGGGLILEHTSVSNLEYFPKHVGKNVVLKSNKLTSLQGMVKRVEGEFKVNEEKYLKSLEGGPVYVGSFLSLSGTDNLDSYNGFPQNDPANDWHGSDGPSDIETKFILDSRYINNTKPDFGMISKRMKEQGIDPQYGNYDWDQHMKSENEPRYVDYWAELLEYILRVDKSKISDVKWPKEFIEKQTDELKNIMKSSAGLRKFNIDQ